ncbi:MAG: hypothetical protein HYR72_03645 [Deltaproteobacteria bacterium]|nr:hypothetical protein [Deltaproteobacteria bacterium]MBI3388718.1 hypothetical protein [Deltaproteobacteria bacterium]
MINARRELLPVIAFSLVTWITFPVVGAAQPLQLTAEVQGTTFAPNDPVFVTVRMKNVGVAPLVIPAMEPFPDNYITLKLIHRSGLTAFFVDPAKGTLGQGRAPATEVLQPDQEKAFEMFLNYQGVGPLAERNPGQPNPIAGMFTVVAHLDVNDTNLPSEGDLTSLFRGTVTSAPSPEFQVIGPEPVAVPVVSWVGYALVLFALTGLASYAIGRNRSPSKTGSL